MWRSAPAPQDEAVGRDRREEGAALVASRISLMATAQSQHRLGIALIVAAAVAWSTAEFFTRLLPFDSWTILFWRGLVGGGLIAALLVLLPGRGGLGGFSR